MADPKVGWCIEHQTAIVIYDDGSYSCMHELIVEHSDHDCHPRDVPPSRQYRAPTPGRTGGMAHYYGDSDDPPIPGRPDV